MGAHNDDNASISLFIVDYTIQLAPGKASMGSMYILFAGDSGAGDQPHYHWQTFCHRHLTGLAKG